MLTDRLINEMGLLKLRAKAFDNTTEVSPEPKDIQALSRLESQPAIRNTANQHDSPTGSDQANDQVQLDKDQFRLLVKMLQAIGHDCTFDQISHDGQTVVYQHPRKTLVFNDINLADTKQIINLSSLSDLLSKPELKRPVWEKLKTI